jgi:tRNA(adenine34) deaminase
MTDIDIMRIAIQEAKKAYLKANFPVGAVLLINNEIIDKSHNQNKEFGTLYSHAENSLLIKHSASIKEAGRRNETIELFSTLEPCLYCFGGLLQHNINRLVYSVSDPVVGSCSLLPYLSEWYHKKNIIIEKNVLTEEYLPILYEYNKRHNKYEWDKLIAINKR